VLLYSGILFALCLGKLIKDIEMETNNRLSIASSIGILILGLFLANTSNAALINCSADTTKNYMQVDDSVVSSCLGSGTGNINGNLTNDPWLTTSGAGYTLVSKDDASNPFNITTVDNNGSGTFTIDASYWDTNTTGAIGFKFGTGNEPDEWFVYDLVQGVSSGDWNFINVFGKGGGLSHTNLYSTNEPPSVPEPSIVALFGLGLFGMGLTRRRVMKLKK